MVPARAALAVARAVRRGLSLRDGGRPVPFRTVLVGSLRRGEPATKDIDILVVVPRLPRAPLEVAVAGCDLRPVRRGARLQSFVARCGGAPVPVDLFFAAEAAYPYALLHHTGPWEFSVRVRAHAKGRGLLLNQYGLFHRASGRAARGSRRARTERDVLRLVGVTYRPPAERTG